MNDKLVIISNLPNEYPEMVPQVMIGVIFCNFEKFDKAVLWALDVLEIRQGQANRLEARAEQVNKKCLILRLNGSGKAEINRAVKEWKSLDFGRKALERLLVSQRQEFVNLLQIHHFEEYKAVCNFIGSGGFENTKIIRWKGERAIDLIDRI